MVLIREDDGLPVLRSQSKRTPGRKVDSIRKWAGKRVCRMSIVQRGHVAGSRAEPLAKRALQCVEVDDAEASTQHNVGVQLVLHAKPWLEVIRVGRIIISVRRTGKLQAAIESKARHRRLQRVRARGAESVVQPVVA